MARRHLSSADNIADLLTCSVCLEPFDEAEHQPKLLPCHHSFCKHCLLQLARNYSYIDCPTCRERIALSCAAPAGISRLQTNFYVTQMREILGGDQRTSRERCVCRKHGNNPLKFFCQSCEVEICQECCNGDHKESARHVVMDMNDAIAEQRRLLDVEVTEAHHIVTVNSAHLQSFESEMGALYAAKEGTLADLNSAFDKYIEVLNHRRQQLIEATKEEYRCRRELLAAEVETLKRQATSLSALIDQCHDAILGGSISDILAYKAKMVAKNREVRAENQQHNYQNPGSNYIKYDPMENDCQFLDVVSSLGGVVVKEPLPTLVKPLETVAIASLFTNLSMVITNTKGEELENYPLSVDILDPYDDDVPNLVQYRSNGRYEVTFRPKVSGMHRLRVKFLDHPISKGGFSIKVQSNDPVGKIGSCDIEGEKLSLEYPRAVAVDSRNSVYVVDTGNSCIQKFDRNGKFVFSFPICPETHEFSSCGIALNNQQGLLVCPEVCIHEADMSNANTLLVYSKEGHLHSRFSYPDLLRQAFSVAVSSSGHIIVADSELNTIFIMDKHGRFLKKFGQTGTGPGQFNRPTFVCIGENDCIIVSDGDNNRIQVFDKAGKFMYAFGEPGSGKGQFHMPFGVIVDYHGNILVVDGGNKRIQIFKYGGEFVSCIESLSDPMRAPRGIAVTTDGHVWVADRDNHCIKKFKYLHCTSL